MWMGIVAAGADLIVSLVVTKFTQPKPEAELVGLVKGLETPPEEGDLAVEPWYKRPVVLGSGAIILAMSMYIPFIFI